MNIKKDVNYYANLNWSFTVEQETHNGQHYYIIRVNELPGVCTDAATLEEGMQGIKECIRGAIKLYLKNGEKVPEPINKEAYRGNIAYRTTRERHHNVAKFARSINKSISKTIDYLVDTGLGHRAIS